MVNVQNIIRQLQTDTTRMQYQQGRGNVGTGKLDSNAFMKLLMAQLTHQDPMNPIEDAQFISQQAQFAQLEKTDQMLSVMKSSNLLGQAGSLVGRTVDIKATDGSLIRGRVDSVKISADSVNINVGGKAYAVDQIQQIYANAAS
ncbi:MAG: hypothetical protein IPK79_04635 [Vampirovibrionales bacterium]|nr:hypothetical protein [Vampirovibrionales bacterium]